MKKQIFRIKRNYLLNDINSVVLFNVDGILNFSNGDIIFAKNENDTLMYAELDFLDKYYISSILDLLEENKDYDLEILINKQL